MIIGHGLNAARGLEDKGKHAAERFSQGRSRTHHHGTRILCFEALRKAKRERVWWGNPFICVCLALDIEIDVINMISKKAIAHLDAAERLLWDVLKGIRGLKDAAEPAP